MDIERLGAVPADVIRDPTLDLPLRVIDQHRWLARRSDYDLQRVIVAASIHLAMRLNSLPQAVLDDAGKSVSKFKDWPAVRAKIASIQEGIEPAQEGITTTKGTNDEVAENVQVRSDGLRGQDAIGRAAAAEPGAC